MSAGERAEFDRWLHVVAACAVAAAGVGLGTNLLRDPAPVRSFASAPPGHGEGEVAPAPTQGELGSRRNGYNRARHPVAFAAMGAERPPLTDELPFDPAARAAVVARRAERRAYDGAPPTIPHPIAQMAVPNCVSCHDEGMRVRNHVAPSMSHDPRASCVQCHVVNAAPMPGALAEAGPPFADNTFAGSGSAGRGERAWPGAPPTIPHPTTMRERCASCHGVLGAGLRSSHPWRQSCTQCHGPSAALDQRATLALPPVESEGGATP